MFDIKQPDFKYLHTKVSLPDGTYQVWNSVQINTTIYYYLVKLLDPNKEVETIKYTQDLSRLGNVDVNTHFSISEQDLIRVLADPSILQWVKPEEPKTTTYSLKPKLKLKSVV